MSDSVYSEITGIPGFFDTRIVFVDETGPRDERRKRLAIMDQDGANVRYLTPGDNSVVTPRFSPRNQEIAFMAQSRGEQPRVQVLNIETGARQAVGNFPDMTSSPRFSPDGRSILMALQQGGNANLYQIDLHSRTTTRLTSTGAIDTSPSFSPDGSRIVFESDRGGRQQLYVMNADGSDAERISFGDGSYSQPVWSPRGDLIAFTRMSDGQFSIGVMRPDGSGERILTEGYHNESPAWAPNGQYLVFFREPPRRGRRTALHGRCDRAGRDAGPDAELRLGSDLVTLPERLVSGTARSAGAPQVIAKASYRQGSSLTVSASSRWPSGSSRAACEGRSCSLHRWPSISSRETCHVRWSGPRRSR